MDSTFKVRLGKATLSYKKFKQAKNTVRKTIKGTAIYGS
jgi:hypothetical protein